MRSFILLALTLSIAAAIDFQSEALKNYHSCGEMSKQECLTWHEAQDQCGGPSCSQAGQGSSTTPSPSGSTQPPDGKKSKGKGGKGKGGKGGKGCFYGDDTVMTNYGPMQIKDMVGKSDLQLLSRSEDNRVEMSPIMSWLHADAEKSMKFVEFNTESGHTLRLTETHLIYETDCRGNKQTIFANKLTVGNCVIVNDNAELVESKIVDKTIRLLKGIYAPVTVNGNVIVNDVLASCYVAFENEAALKVLFNSLNSLNNVLNYLMPQALVNTFMNTPFKSEVDVSQLFVSFLDLASSFIKNVN
jgi:hypothetical protein